MSPFSSDLDVKIRQTIRACGQQAQTLSKQSFQVSEKGPEDYVTSVDRALDAQLSMAFGEMFAQDGIVTEENAQSRQAFYKNYSRIWFIDPLDGTEDFIHGRAGFAVMVGSLEQAQPTAGWIYAPAQDRMFYGGPGWGLFQTIADSSPEALKPIEPPPLTATCCPVILGDRDRANFGQVIAQQIPEIQFYSLGSFGLKVIELILGRAGLYVYLNRRVKLWDTTGPLALAQEAGLVCCDLAGQPLSFLPDAIDPDTLAHKQPILVGWSSYMDVLRPQIAAAIGNH
ncbi:MAG: inositol monophosphatase family protein [Scytolyngbya sp. HA4215-MV1]|jgi:3'(2'), 5'-bisphosphate nucleotidase|nr:inositol monophosphatase family protein [Scytolyngbya sp. HA4215-MV1]